MDEVRITCPAPKLVASRNVAIPGLTDRNGRLCLEKLRNENREPVDYERMKVQELFTLADVAVVLSMSKRTVETAVQKGELPTVKGLGGRRVTKAQLETYVRSLEIQAGFRRPAGM